MTIVAAKTYRVECLAPRADYRGAIVSAPDLVVVEVMPDHHRGNHRAARNWGRYPHNGAKRFAASVGEAACIVREDMDNYDHIVEGANPSDYPDWTGEVQS